MNVVVIEDEVFTAQRLINLIKKYDPGVQILAELASVESSVKWLEDYGNTNNGLSSIDLIFMDIHLEDGDSFQIFKKINLATPIIFTTAFDEYMVQAFKVNSIDYLLKPINYEDLAGAIDKLSSLKKHLAGQSEDVPNSININQLLAALGKNEAKGFRDRFMITIGTKMRTVKTADIAYFFLEEKAVFFTTYDKGTFPIDYSLDKLMQMLDPKFFFRVNRQFIVSVDSVETVHYYSTSKLKLDLKPKPRQEVLMSGDRISDFKEWLGK